MEELLKQLKAAHNKRVQAAVALLLLKGYTVIPPKAPP